MITTPCACGRMAVLYEGPYEQGRLLKIKCACGLEGASLTYRKPEDRQRTIWAALDGWSISNGNGLPQ